MSEIEKCRLCGSFAVQSVDLRERGFYVHCFNEFSTETWDCDAPAGPRSPSSAESVRAWNELQCPEGKSAAPPPRFPDFGDGH